MRALAPCVELLSKQIEAKHMLAFGFDVPVHIANITREEVDHIWFVDAKKRAS